MSDRAASSDGGLRAACLGTLARCDRGTYTVPSPLTYPHQWNWDSAFAALGWLCVDPRRAWQELETLTGAQARDGLVPHIAYASPRPLERLAPLLHRIPSLARFLPALVRSRYSPSPGWWGWLRGRDGRLRSAITQPPVAATAARMLFESTGDELAARRLLAPLSRWHAFLLGARDPCGLGEPVLIHPWESGRDNAVEWDAPLARIRPAVRVVPRPDRRYVDAAERPSDDHYRRFMTLVREGTRRGWPQRELAASGPRRTTLEELLGEGGAEELNLVVKADVAGSVEALKEALAKLSTDEVRVNVVRSGVGAVTDSDIMLASASGGIVIGFNVRPTNTAKQVAEREGVEIRTYDVIYKVIEEIEAAMKGMLAPETAERETATAEVRATFRVPNVGTVAGCYVTSGEIRRNNRVRVVRDGTVVYDGQIASLKRFKDDVRTVREGFECGVGIENFNDVKEGDVLEFYEVVEIPR